MARRARFLSAVLLATLLLAGCGGQEQGGQPEEEAAAPETTAGTAETTAEERTAAEATGAPSGGTAAESTQAAPAPSAPQGSSEEAGLGDPANAETTVTVTRVVDGDTLEISPAVEGITDLRLVGVDTPETKKPGCAPQSYGAEASAFTTAELQGRRVGLEFDAERTDRYGRLLAYVYPSDGAMFNETLLREGYAQVATFPPNVRYVEEFRAAQEEARTAGRGLWGLSPEELAQQTDRGNGIGGDGCAPPAATQPPPQQQQPPPASPPEPPPEPADPPVPDVPPPSDFPEPIPEAPAAPAVPAGGARCSDFATEAEAIAALPSNPQLDRDGDGRACESLP